MEVRAVGEPVVSSSKPVTIADGSRDLTLDVREWICEQCGVVHERDLNASLNIRDEALRLVTDVPVVASSERKTACGAGSAGS
jgi:transposase